MRGMGTLQPAVPVKLICGMIGADRDLMFETQEELARAFGPVDLASEFLPFTFTSYYREEMGDGLARRFLSFSEPIDPASLAAIKTATQAIEGRRSVVLGGTARRRVNLDPGYVTPWKLVLASTKDAPHRVCLGQGVYAEVTFQFRKAGIAPLAWTYPDFRSGIYTPFFLEVRRRWLAARGALAK